MSTIIFMCGRFALNHKPSMLEEWYETTSMPEFSLHYNISPGNSIVVIRATPDGRFGSLMRWGLIPAWAKDPSSLPMLHNARGETVAEKPVFRQAFKKRRCIVPVSGFFEWKTVAGQRLKQPFFVSFKDGTPMSLAGLWETNRPAEGGLLDTCTIITTGANELLEPIHHRMPVILERNGWDNWLDGDTAPVEEITEMLKPFDPDKMQVWGVSHAVNRVTNNESKLLQPIA